MYRFLFLFFISHFAYTLNLAAQKDCCDEKFKAGKKALDSNNYREAIRFFIQGRGCEDTCKYDFADFIKQAQEAERVASTLKSKYKPPTVSMLFVEPQMVKVDGGTFEMGSNDYNFTKPIHTVSVNDFYIGKYEVTQAEWRSIMGKNPPELNFKNCDNCPVERVSWDDIQDFLTKLNIKTGKKYRLPTEIEWEFAARGGNKSNGYTYSGSNNLQRVAWFSDNSEGKTHEVGQLKPNELGICDMSGNVWEWCQDWYKGYSGSSGVSDFSGTNRVNRGGSWNNLSKKCRPTNRDYDTPAFNSHSIGLRLAYSL
jgi:formylglycine-generating enzyme required for sulfatase activity